MKPWHPSSTPYKETVWVCDGETAYEMAFGQKNALRQLYEAFPLLLGDLLGETSITNGLEIFYDQTYEL